ncbi:MAG: PGPGW domain-containing protein [Candidatus Eisenbacteria bacterium]|nr:PGPGW domain-containing protein [Candidatus Eisenbacteria bacterium]
MNWVQGYGTAIWWATGVSVVTFIVGIVAVPMLMIRVPADYFAHPRRSRMLWAGKPPAIRAVLLAGKNLLGWILVAAGILMLVLPGQGILTILIGLMLLDFPGKFRVERWIVAHRPIFKLINWIRRRAGRPPLVLEK